MAMPTSGSCAPWTSTSTSPTPAQPGS
jgi:hypothetical protein